MLINAGKIRATYKGGYDDTVTYEFLDVVYLDGSSYICTNEYGTIASESPTTSDKWTILALKGATGSSFAISKTYISIEDMNNDYENPTVALGSFVIISTEDPEATENGMLFVKGDSQYNFITDLSGSQGIQGPKGDDGQPGTQGPKGDSITAATINSNGELVITVSENI